ncbi:MAG: histidine--tRNA ligase [Candidatus Omnitrophica bacterium]|nr:histidine--tRNA ligase [Candidatus Omnitrophota bacterium]MDD5553470.1 histidine--tRNA ligase [Candidatus Omnitrophota bacterium]
MFKRTPGTKDILPEEALRWQAIEETTRAVFSLYNYREIRTPLIEEASLFNRSLGESAEIVQKQMFLIKKEDETFALRPEGTAGIVRAYIENNLDKTSGFIKVYYTGPMFRAERPQKGRLRQFHHIGCEAIGSEAPYLDAEVISLADNLLKAYGIRDYETKINSLGCAKDKKALTEGLRAKLEPKLDQLCADCKTRYNQNVLRVLDCKNEHCIEIVKKLEIGENYLCDECKGHFAKVKEGLDSLKVNYTVSPYLVRGLDYYTRTVFEFIHGALGSQNALGAGGRYDNLVSELGGPKAGAIGFAMGVERLLLVTNHKPQVTSKGLVYIISLGDEAKKAGAKLLYLLREAGVASDTDHEDRSLKGAMRRANDMAAKTVLIIGEDEIKKGVVTLKDMASGEQKEIKRENILEELKAYIKLTC